MTITHIRIYRFSIRMEPFVIATGTMHFAQNVLIKVYTTDAITGTGECSAFPMIVGETQETCLAMAKEFAAVWKGKDPLNIPERLQELEWVAAHNTTIKSAFDMALYDIASQAAGLPLYQFLGGSRREVETDMTIGIGTPAEMAAQAMHFKEECASILKIKVGKNVHDDIERVSQVRTAAGTSMKIRIDANQGWSYEDALIALQAMAKFNIEFCEQPMRTWFDDYLPALCAASPIPIMADESCCHHHDARRLIQSKSCDAINIKLAKSGGIAEAKKIHDTALQYGVACMLGSMLESRFALTANLHFAYAGSNIHYFDLDTCLLGQLEDPVTGGVVYNGFNLSLQDVPGIGAGIDEEFLKQCDQWSV